MSFRDTANESGSAATGKPAGRVFRVAEVAAGVRQLLEERVGRLWISGELSNVHYAASGHVYFTLKDDDAQLRAALFRSSARRVPFELEDGLSVWVYGELSLYAPRGDLQVIVREVQPKGVGALQLAFEQLRASLEAEGLFDPALKRELPEHPRTVGVVTSDRGAAIHDVIEVLAGRAPDVPVLLAPARVQGEGAEIELAAQLRALSACPDVDVILLVRGGGSLEDLSAFNTERLAREIRACSVPVVAGVGHEVDVTIADWAADHREPTPSAAAAAVVADRSVLADHFLREEQRLHGALEGHLAGLRADWLLMHNRLQGNAPRIRLAERRARLEGLCARIETAMSRGLEAHRSRLHQRLAGLDALSPLAVLGRGYAIATRSSGQVVRRASELLAGESLDLRFGEGRASVQVEDTSEDDPASV